jgi:aspartate aminotransferase
MTVGCAGAMNAALKAILDPGSEVIVNMPFFPDYQFYILNHGGRMVSVETRPDFSLDVAAIESKITPQTRARPELPEQSDGVDYSESVLRDLETVSSERSPIVVLSDEPTR